MEGEGWRRGGVKGGGRGAKGWTGRGRGMKGGGRGRGRGVEEWRERGGRVGGVDRVNTYLLQLL